MAASKDDIAARVAGQLEAGERLDAAVVVMKLPSMGLRLLIVAVAVVNGALVMILLGPVIVAEADRVFAETGREQSEVAIAIPVLLGMAPSLIMAIVFLVNSTRRLVAGLTDRRLLLVTFSGPVVVKSAWPLASLAGLAVVDGAFTAQIRFRAAGQSHKLAIDKRLKANAEPAAGLRKALETRSKAAA